jgi:choline dehydrogenase-like flavoprotein
MVALAWIRRRFFMTSPADTAGYDVVVVGAGSAGIPLAVRLSVEHGWRVALVEAGPHYGRIEDYPRDLRHAGLATPYLPGHPNNWAFPVELTDEGMTQSLPRGRAVGGSSTINGTIFERGLPIDFEEWAAAGNTEWAFEKVLPFFRKSETDLDFSNEWHGASGPIRVHRHTPEEWVASDDAFVESCKAHGFAEDVDMNAPDTHGVGPLPMNVIGGIRQNVAHCYLERALMDCDRLALFAECVARRVVFSDRRAIGVEVSHQGERKVIHADEVILSAGAVKSPHLLMLSGVGPAEELKRHGVKVVSDSPGVGRNFSDHCVAPMTIAIQDLRTIDPTRHPAMHVGMHFTAEDSPFPGDLFCLPGANPHNVALLHGVPLLRRTTLGLKAMRAMSVRRVLEEAGLGRSLSLSVILMKGYARGEVRLASADPTAKPLIRYHYLSDSADIRRLRYGVRLMTSLITESEGYRRLRARLLAPRHEDLRSDDGLDRYIRRTLATCIHMAGTCRMGPDHVEAAVVDQYCRVKNVENLRVVDTSIWPETTRRCSHATAVMTGERAAALFSGA